MSRHECQKLQLLRRRVDQLDMSILLILAARFCLVKEIGALKRGNGIPVVDDSRFKRMMARLTRAGKQVGLSPRLVRVLWDLIHRESVRIQGRKKRER